MCFGRRPMGKHGVLACNEAADCLTAILFALRFVVRSQCFSLSVFTLQLIARLSLPFHYFRTPTMFFLSA